ncbi:DNA primase catalytic subunit PriS [archaeon]|nr:DNA primase catalytic subunit PriS [archaeon]
MNRGFILRKFREYYSKNEVKAPPQIEQREFGIGLEKKIDSRHMQFQNADKLNFYLRSAVPLYISYSAAFYEFPEARPMPNKNRTGADLIFDLDADECDVSCTHPHDEVCSDCMRQVKLETERLVNGFLKPDFGFKNDDLTIVFSGNRGFHIHVRSDIVHDFDQNARKEIVEYIGAEKIKLVHPGENRQLYGPTIQSAGWGGKIALTLYETIRSSENTKEFKKKTGLLTPAINNIFRNKTAALEAMRTGIWSKVPVSANAWDDLVKDLAGKLRVNLDKNVTMDMARLLRLPGSLHGGTGLVACEITDLHKFDAFSDPIVFGDTPCKVTPKQNKTFLLNKKEYSLEKEKSIELPEYAAIYAICKNWVNIHD